MNIQAQTHTHTHTHTHTAPTTFQNQAQTIMDMDKNTYLIKIPIQSAATPQQVAKVLQWVYDQSGVSGTFEVSNEKAGELMITASRSAVDDAEYIYPRMQDVTDNLPKLTQVLNKAIVEQYFDELTVYGGIDQGADYGNSDDFNPIFNQIIDSLINNRWSVDNTGELSSQVLAIKDAMPSRITDIAKDAVNLADNALRLQLTAEYLLLSRPLITIFNSARADLCVTGRSTDFSDPLVADFMSKARVTVDSFDVFDRGTIEYDPVVIREQNYGLIKKSIIDELKSSAESVLLSSLSDDLDDHDEFRP